MYAVGGVNNIGRLSSVECYCVEEDRWKYVASTQVTFISESWVQILVLKVFFFCFNYSFILEKYKHTIITFLKNWETIFLKVCHDYKKKQYSLLNRMHCATTVDLCIATNCMWVEDSVTDTLAMLCSATTQNMTSGREEVRCNIQEGGIRKSR